MPKFKIKDSNRGTETVIDARDSAEAYTLYKQQLEQPGWGERALGMAESVVSAPYLEKGKPRLETSYTAAALRPFTQTVEGVIEGARVLGRRATHPGDPTPTGEKLKALLGIASPALLAAYPALIPILMASSVAGEATYGATGSPVAGGIVDLVVSMLGPGGMAKIARHLARKEGARVAAETKALEGIEAVKTMETKIVPALPEERLTPTRFGEEFKRFPDPEEGVEPGMFFRAKKARYKEATDLYEDVTSGVKNMEIPTGEIVKPLEELLERSGISAQLAPTKAEQFAKKVIKTLAPAEEEAIYEEAYSMLTQPQIQALKEGGVVPGSLPAEFGRILARHLEGKTAAGMKAEMGERFENIVNIPDKLTLGEIVDLRKIVNAWKRAAYDSAKMPLGRQFSQISDSLVDAVEKISPPTAAKLKAADKFYKREYIELFGPRAELSKISEHDASVIFDQLTKRPERVKEIMSVLTDEEKAKFHGAFYLKLMGESIDMVEGWQPTDFVKAYKAYPEEVKAALLGNQKQDWDKVVTAVGQFDKRIPEDVQAVRNGINLALKQGRISKEKAAEFQERLSEITKPTHFGSYRAKTSLLFGAKDVFEYLALGIGGTRILGFGLADFMTWKILSDPELMTRLTNRHRGVMNLVGKALDRQSPAQLRSVNGLYQLATRELELMEQGQ